MPPGNRAVYRPDGEAGAAPPGYLHPDSGRRDVSVNEGGAQE